MSDAIGPARLSHVDSAMNTRIKIYWSLKQVPELAELTWRERNLALKQFSTRYILRARPSWSGLVAYLAPAPLIRIAGIFAARALWPFPTSIDLAEAVAACAGFFFGLFLSFQISVSRLARFLRDHRSHEGKIVF